MAVATDREFGLFIGGEASEPASGDVRELTEPATGEPLARAAMAGEADVDRAVEAARTAVEGDWGRTPGTERSRLLHALADAIVANRAELAELESRNVGKAIASVKAELHQAVENFRYYASAIASISGRSNPIGGSLLFYSPKEPVGVAAQIVPWNYPLMMATWKLAPALAAGCSVVLKPDPQTPLTAIRLAELAAEVGFPAGALNVVPGDGPTTGAYLVRHPGVDKVAFTGSTRTGGEIMRLASDPVKRVTLELGGKSPNLVFADADLASALPSSAWSIFYAAGQSCEARSRMLVEKPLYEEAVSTDGRARRKHQGGRPSRSRDADGIAHLRGPPRARTRLRRARRGRGRRGPRGRRGVRTVLARSTHRPSSRPRTMRRSHRKRSSAPSSRSSAFEDEKDAIRIANDVRYGLMATVWTGDPARGHRIAARINRARSASTCRTRRSPGSRSAATSSPASDVSSRSRRSISTSRRRA